MIKAMPAVVVGAGLNGLGLARSLRRGHVPVWVVDVSRFRPAMWSFKCRTSIIDGLGGRALVDDLIKLSGKIAEDAILFLTDDMSIQTVSEHREELARHYWIRLPAHDVVVDLFDKAKFYKLATDSDFPVPKTVVVETIRDLNELAELAFPAVIKPADKLRFLAGKAERLYKVATLDQAAATCRRILPDAGKLIVQEWISGPDSNMYFCLFYRGENGVAVGIFTGQKLCSDPPELGGNTAVCRAAPEIGHLLEPMTLDFADRVKFDGMGSLEFKWDPAGCRFVMIEATVGRVDWQEEIATLCGVNIPLMAYNYEMDLPPMRSQPVSVDVGWCASYFKRVRYRPNRRFQTRLRVYDGHWRRSDPGPAIYYYVVYGVVTGILRYVLKPLADKWRKRESAENARL